MVNTQERVCKELIKERWTEKPIKSRICRMFVHPEFVNDCFVDLLGDKRYGTLDEIRFPHRSIRKYLKILGV